MISAFAGLTLRIPDGWCDITSDLPPGSPPTLARRTGVGALQFSVAKYQRGATPSITEEDLRELLRNFCDSHSLSGMQHWSLGASKTLCVGGRVTTPTEAIGIWYLSNGVDVAFLTYTSLEPGDDATEIELAEANGIVNSAEFHR